MAKKAKKRDCPELPLWMVTFTDCMTLMLTFFVLLVSMSKVDEQRKLVALGSIIGAFGWDTSFDLLTTETGKKTVEPGPLDNVQDLESLKQMLWEDINQDLRFESNRFVQVLSISTEVLFLPGQTTLSPEGRDLLTRMLPVLSQVRYPLLIAGHTASLRDELGTDYRTGDADLVPDPTWKISLNRALAVYAFLLENGLDPANLRVEGFGRFAPHYNNSDAKERMRNRRVDIVLDKRSQEFTQRLSQEAGPAAVQDNSYDVDGFRFRLDNQGP